VSDENSGETAVKNGDIVEKLLAAMERKEHELQAASGQIGWLRAKLEERETELLQKDQTIKLLEDKQKLPWWRRTWCWFVSAEFLSNVVFDDVRQLPLFS
jgi:hypothetical protein